MLACTCAGRSLRRRRTARRGASPRPAGRCDDRSSPAPRSCRRVAGDIVQSQRATGTPTADTSNAKRRADIRGDHRRRRTPVEDAVAVAALEPRADRRPARPVKPSPAGVLRAPLTGARHVGDQVPDLLRRHALDDDRPMRGVHGGQHVLKARSPANRGVATPRQWGAHRRGGSADCVVGGSWNKAGPRPGCSRQEEVHHRARPGRALRARAWPAAAGPPRPGARADRLHRRRLRGPAAARPPARDARAPAGRHLRRRPAARLSLAPAADDLRQPTTGSPTTSRRSSCTR